MAFWPTNPNATEALGQSNPETSVKFTQIAIIDSCDASALFCLWCLVQHGRKFDFATHEVALLPACDLSVRGRRLLHVLMQVSASRASQFAPRPYKQRARPRTWIRTAVKAAAWRSERGCQQQTCHVSLATSRVPPVYPGSALECLMYGSSTPGPLQANPIPLLPGGPGHSEK